MIKKNNVFSGLCIPISLVVFLLCARQTHSQGVSSEVKDAKLCRAVDVCLKRMDVGKKCKIFPVPKKAFIRPFPPSTFELVPLRKGVWAYQDGIYISLILKQDDRLVMVDIAESFNSNKPNGSQTLYTDAAEKVLNGTVPRRIDIIYSHGHLDHIGSTNRFIRYMERQYPRSRIVVWGTQESKEVIEKSVTDKAPIPDVIIGKRGRTLALGEGLSVNMWIVGGHTASDLVIHIPRYEREVPIVYYVDVVFPGWSPTFNLAITNDVGSYIGAQKEVLKLDFEVFVGGHFVLGDRQSVATNVAFAEDLVEAAKVAIAETSQEDFDAAGFKRFSDPDAREYGNPLFLVMTTFRQTQVDVCYRIMLEKWGCRIAGFDISGKGHCFTALAYIVTDY